MTGKGEKERYTQLNAEFHRIARREKKASLNEQCQETEENNRMGTTRDNIQENWRYQRNVSCKDGHDIINSMDITEVEEIKKRWQEYTEELYQKGLIPG